MARGVTRRSRRSSATVTRASAFANAAKSSVKAAGASVRFVVARIVLVVLAVAVCAVVPIFVNDVIGYLPLIALVLLIIISFVYLLIMRRMFTFDEDSLAASCERGSEMDFVLHFSNRSFMVLCRFEVYIYVSDLFDNVDSVMPVPLTLMPFEDKEFHFQAVFDHIGTYSAGVQKIVVYDLLGLFIRTIKNNSRHYIEVLPRLFEANEVPLTSEASMDSQKPRQALTLDELDYAGVRDYEWGDSIKTIHWKLSAREPEGKYLTRLFETYNNPGISIILDTTSPNYDAESLMYVYDSIVESALSINQHALAQGIDSYLAFQGRDDEAQTMRVSGINDFPEITRALPRIEPGDGEKARELLRREMNSIHGQDNIAFCTAHVNEETITLLTSLKLRKRNPLLFLIVPPSMTSDEVHDYTLPLRPLNDALVPYFVVSAASELGVEKLSEEELEAAAAAEAKNAEARAGTVREVGGSAGGGGAGGSRAGSNAGAGDAVGVGAAVGAGEGKEASK